MSDKAKEILKNFLGYIIIFFTCILYILTELFVLGENGKTISQIIAEGFVAFLMGVGVDRMFSIQGITNGMRSDIVNSTMSLYGQTVEKINGFINKLGEWCFEKNAITYKRERILILARAGLKYEDCFDEDGRAKPFTFCFIEKPINKDKERLKNPNERQLEIIRIKEIQRHNKEGKADEKYKRKCYNQAVKLRLSELHANELTSEGGKKDDPNYLGQTIGEYIRVDSFKTIALKFFMAILFGIYGVTLITEFSWVGLIWKTFQVCIFLILGLVKMKASAMFITNDFRGRIIKKIDNLEEFDADIKSKENKNEQEVDKGTI